MPTIDPNVYALSIQLSLETAQASSALDSFENSLIELGDKVSASAQQALSAIQAVLSDINARLQETIAAFSGMETVQVRINQNLQDATKDLQKQYDTNLLRLEDMEKEYDDLEDMIEFYDKILKSVEDELDAQQQIVKTYDQIIKAIIEKNKEHASEAGLISDETDLLRKAAEATGEQEDRAVRLAEIWARIRSAFASYIAYLLQASQETMRFVAVNYRFYGSQQQLAYGARRIAAEYGLFYDKAMEAYAVLGDLRVPRDELDKYAKTVAQTSHVTRVNVQAVGEYVNRLRVLGMTSMQAERQLVFMTEAMRRFGLNTSDVSRLMQGSTGDLRTMIAALGGGSEAIEKWEKSRTLMAAFGRQLGLGVEGAIQYHEWLSRDIAAMHLLGHAAGMQIRNADDFAKAQIKASIAVSEALQELRDELAATGDVVAYRARVENLANVYYGGSQDALHMAAALGQLAKEMNLSGESAEDLDIIINELARRMDDTYAEANRSTIAQLTILKNTIWALVAQFLQFIDQALVPILQVINQLVQGFAKAVGIIVDFISWLEEIPVIGKAVTFLKWLTGVLIAAAMGFLIVGFAINSFSIAFYKIPGAIEGAMRIVQSIATTMASIAQAIGQSIAAVLAGIGNGLRALGTAVRPVVGPLLAMAVALVLVAAAIWILASATRTIAELGMTAAMAMFQMIVAVALLSAIMIGLAMLVQGPVALGLIVLALAILLVGAAIMMAGLGVMFMAQGLSMIAGVISGDLIAAVAGLCVVLLLLGATALVAAPGLLILAALFLATSVAALILGAALLMIATAITMLSTVSLSAIAMELLKATPIFIAAGLAMIVAGAALAVGGTTIMIASAVILVAAVLLVAAGLLFAVGAQLMSFGALSLLLAGAMIAAGSVMLFLGITMVLVTIGMILVAATLMGVAGVALIIGGVILAVGLAVVLVAAAIALVAGTALLIGGILLLYAAAIISVAAALLLISGVMVGVGGIMMVAGLAAMLVASAMMLPVGMALLLGSLWLAAGAAAILPAATTIGIAGMSIGIGGIMMYIGLSKIGDAVKMMKDIGKALHEAVGSLIVSGTMLAVSSSVLLIAGTVIMAATPALIAGLTALNVAVAMLIVTAAALYVGAAGILTGATLLWLGSELMIHSSTISLLAGTYLLLGAQTLFTGSNILVVAGAMLLAAAAMIMYAALVGMPATALLLAMAIALIPVPFMIAGVSTILLSAAMLLAAGAAIIHWAVLTLLEPGILAIASIVAIASAGSAGLLSAATSLWQASSMMVSAGLMLIPASIAIYVGMRWLRFAISYLAPMVNNIDRVARAMSMLAMAFAAISSIQTSAFTRTTSGLSSAASDIAKFGSSLTAVAGKLERGVTAFRQPVNELIGLLDRLNESVAVLNAGSLLIENVAELAGSLDRYAALLENAVERIQVAVDSRAIPAMRAAEEAGIEETIRSEAITTVRLMVDREVLAEEEADQQIELTRQMLEVLRSLNECVISLQHGSSDGLTKIIELLQTHLPNMNKPDRGLSSEFNSWMR